MCSILTLIQTIVSLETGAEFSTVSLLLTVTIELLRMVITYVSLMLKEQIITEMTAQFQFIIERRELYSICIQQAMFPFL